MLTDPQSVTVNGGALSFPAVSRGSNASIYHSSQSWGELDLKVSTTTGKRARTVARLDQSKLAENPFTAKQEEVSASVYLVIDRPLTGFTDEALDSLAQGLMAWLDSAKATRLLAGET